MTVYGYARVWVREPENRDLDLQVEPLARAGCTLGNIRAEEANTGPRTTGVGYWSWSTWRWWSSETQLAVTHIDRLSRGLTYFCAWLFLSPVPLRA